jgi:hypothetical protein
MDSIAEILFYIIVFGTTAVCFFYALYRAIHQTLDRALDKIFADLNINVKERTDE